MFEIPIAAHEMHLFYSFAPLAKSNERRLHSYCYIYARLDLIPFKIFKSFNYGFKSIVVIGLI